MMAKILEALGLEPPPAEEGRDPVHDLVQRANAQTADSWHVVNESRQRRGEPPVHPPSWEELFGKEVGRDPSRGRL